MIMVCMYEGGGWFVITYGFFKISIILADRGFPNKIMGSSLRFVNISFILCVSETDFFYYLNRNIDNKCNNLRKM